MTALMAILSGELLRNGTRVVRCAAVAAPVAPAGRIAVLLLVLLPAAWRSALV